MIKPIFQGIFILFRKNRMLCSAVDVLMSAGDGEGHHVCLKTALVKHENALYRERIMCYDEMFAAHEETQQQDTEFSGVGSRKGC